MFPLLLRRLVGVCSASVLITVVTLICSAPARAAVYGYSVQQTSGYTFSGSGGAATLSVNSSSSASQTGSPSGSDAHSGLADALQSYVGGAAGRPAENTFTPKGQTGADYSRGDSLVATPTLATNNVAEMFLTNAGDNGSGAGAWSVTAPVIIASTGSMSMTFNYTNNINLVNTGSPGGVIQANYSYNMTLQNSTGAVVFTSSPLAVNQSLSLSNTGSISLPGSGAITITTGTLPIGNYSLTLSGTENVFGNLVPEPASCALIALSILGIFHRRRAR